LWGDNFRTVVSKTIGTWLEEDHMLNRYSVSLLKKMIFMPQERYTFLLKL